MTRRPLLAVAVAGSAGLVLLDELVLWSGQPAGDPTAGRVAGWYDDHATRVVLGDALWLVMCVVLVLAVWAATSWHARANRVGARVVGLAAAVLLASSALLAAGLALTGPSAGVADRWWQWEGAAFALGRVALGLCLAIIAVGVVAAGGRLWGPLTALAALVAVMLLPAGPAAVSLAAAMLVLALLVGSEPRRHADPVGRAGTDASGGVHPARASG